MTLKTPEQIKQELDKNSEKTAMTMLGVFIGMMILFMAVWLSYKIAINLHTEHRGVAIIVGIPFNCVLYYLVYQCFNLKNGEFKTDNQGEVDWVVGEKDVLPKAVWQPIKYIATAFFGMVILWSVLALRFDATFMFIIPLLWLYYDTFANHPNIGRNRFWQVVSYLAYIPKMAYAIMFLTTLAVKSLL